jgi:hypothetical protein
VFEVIKIIGAVWIAMILTYGVITIALVAFQYAVRTLRHKGMKTPLNP